MNLDKIMDEIDDCKKRSAIGDLSNLAYRLVVELDMMEQKLKEVAETGMLPDGDSVNVPTKLWLEDLIK